MPAPSRILAGATQTPYWRARVSQLKGHIMNTSALNLNGSDSSGVIYKRYFDIIDFRVSIKFFEIGGALHLYHDFYIWSHVLVEYVLHNNYTQLSLIISNDKYK